jgi:hypothetical protein
MTRSQVRVLPGALAEIVSLGYPSRSVPHAVWDTRHSTTQRPAPSSSLRSAASCCMSWSRSRAANSAVVRAMRQADPLKCRADAVPRRGLTGSGQNLQVGASRQVARPPITEHCPTHG